MKVRDRFASEYLPPDMRSEHAVENQRTIGVVDIGRGQLALDLRLIGSVVGNVEKEATEEHRPEAVLAILGISMAFIAIICGFISVDWPHWMVTGIAIAYSATAISWHGVILAEVSRLSKTGQTATNTGGVLSFANAGQTTYPALFSVLLAAGGGFSLGFILAGPPALLAGVALLRRGFKHDNKEYHRLK